MKENKWKIAIIVLTIIVIILIGMILLKGKDLNPFKNNKENQNTMTGEGKYVESINIQLKDGEKGFTFKDGTEYEDGTELEDGTVFMDKIGE